MVLIGPSPIRSNFMKGSLLPKEALDPKSPYFAWMQKFYDKTKSKHDDAIHPEEVAKTIFQAISNDKTEFRYVVGNYAASLLETRRNNIPYSEFQKNDNAKYYAIVL